VCYVGRLKGSMYLVNARLVVRNAAKTFIANTRLDLRNAANSLQIEGKGGCYLGTQPMGGRGGWRDGGRDHILYARHNKTIQDKGMISNA
jgi:hypothetical protein